MRVVDLEGRLAELRVGVREPCSGLFGPGSPAWAMHSRSVLFLGAGRAALLQLAHPWVAAAVREHSAVSGDPLGRFRRTFAAVLDMLYGDWEAAARAARQVYAIHGGIRGTLPEAAGAFPAGSAYEALDVGALRWVHATLYDTSLRMFEVLVRGLDAEERVAYYADSCRFAGLFGLRRADLSESPAAFDRYFATMCEGPLLGASPETAAFARGLFRPRTVPLRPLFALYERYTAQWLPERLRTELQLPSPGPIDRAFLSACHAALRTAPVWPRSLRCLPAYLRARERCLGEPMPALSRWIERQLFVASPSHDAAPAQDVAPRRAGAGTTSGTRRSPS